LIISFLRRDGTPRGKFASDSIGNSRLQTTLTAARQMLAMPVAGREDALFADSDQTPAFEIKTLVITRHCRWRAYCLLSGPEVFAAKRQAAMQPASTRILVISVRRPQRLRKDWVPEE
jgi:hypothetical protein